MNKPVVASAALLCAAMLVFSQACRDAAFEALRLFAGNVLPVLLPFFMSIRMMEHAGLFDFCLRHKAGSAVIMLLGIPAGFPSGARITGRLLSGGAVSQESAQRLLLCANICSPMFIIGTIAQGFFGRSLAAVPIFTGVLAAALIPAMFAFGRAAQPSNQQEVLPRHEPLPTSEIIAASIRESVESILSVGGCIVFFSVLAAILYQSGLLRLLDLLGQSLRLPDGLASAFIVGNLEMTIGCKTVSSTACSFPMQAAMCAYFLSFGGFSVLIQTLMFIRLEHPGRYLMRRFLLALFSAGLAWAIAVLLQSGAEPVFSDRAQSYVENGATAFAFMISGGIGLFSAYLFAIIAKSPGKSGGRRKR